ncbi:hypothetical protein [uncultured Microbulbifer sp.]|uniref:hypothetical protein n=1 Tax=uncultured Microbulbifer sp. TaxID=348147 RepID=UPI0025D0C9DB|nr:hypothetical protein [uncultured Microbulbifer sp.]
MIYSTLSIPVLPGERYQLQLVQLVEGGEALLQRAEFRARPDNLSEPFTLWYGTCFYEPADKGALASAFSSLPDVQKPDMTVLGGDQVYLDMAFTDQSWSYKPGYSLKLFSLLGLMPVRFIRARLQTLFSRAYRTAWCGGLRPVLQQGATYFLAGDHEFWNDYPNTPGFLPALWSNKLRRVWSRVARDLFHAYQLPDRVTYRQFSVGDEVSFFTLDTRLYRGKGRDAPFASAEALNACESWLESLACPGVLILPAPLVANWQFKPGSREGAWRVDIGWGDHSLADTGQYRDLVSALNATTQDVLIVAGDVHYNRLAQVELNGKTLTEVVSSPLSGLSSAPAMPELEPQVFPDRPTDNIAAPVRYIACGEARPGSGTPASQNNFVTVRFSRCAEGINAEVICWRVNGRGEDGELLREWGEQNILLRHRVTQWAGLDRREPVDTGA